ncbi:hypothetical protein LSCM1_02543 [Leishmania martiniquensis]|uniref:Uncharacterized protein n=1 Tax=Leishmania martiniquensis TaxID=1580590 RepID=A0A836KKS0_9TRYP|nr:hypothetical protein LSCM1_02543 [Leishmania martiniquensis]
MMRSQMMSRRPFHPSRTQQPQRKAAITTVRCARTVACTLGCSAGVPTATGVVVSSAVGAAPTSTSSEANLDAESVRGKRFAFAARRCSRITCWGLGFHVSKLVVIGGEGGATLIRDIWCCGEAASMRLCSRGRALPLRHAVH